MVLLCSCYCSFIPKRYKQIDAKAQSMLFLRVQCVCDGNFDTKIVHAY